MQTAKFPDRIVLTGSDEFEDNKLKSMIWMLEKSDRNRIELCRRDVQKCDVQSPTVVRPFFKSIRISGFFGLYGGLALHQYM
jgi:hypothetical protein